MREIIFNVAWMVGPFLLSPLLVIGLRPLFALFVREGAELFADIDLSRELSAGIGHYLALLNVIILLLMWTATYSCRLADAPHYLSMVLPLAGLLVAALVTISAVRERVAVVGGPAILIGLLTFTGGNLPLMIVVPVALLVM